MLGIPSRKSKKKIEAYLRHGKDFGRGLKKLFDFIRYAEGPIGSHELSLVFEKHGTNVTPHPEGVHMLPPNFLCKEQKNREGEPFGWPMCLSINNTVAHGRYDGTINLGDIVSVDVVVAYNAVDEYRVVLDAAFTIECGIGEDIDNPWFLRPLEALKSIKEKNLLDTESISKEIFNCAQKEPKLSVVSALCGHGIGSSLHEPPYIHNAPSGEVSVSLIDGMCFCPEPIYAKEESLFAEVILEDDGWSISTVSGNPSTHFETTFGVVDGNLVDFVGITDWPTE